MAKFPSVEWCQCH